MAVRAVAVVVPVMITTAAAASASAATSTVTAMSFVHPGEDKKKTVSRETEAVLFIPPFSFLRFERGLIEGVQTNRR